MPHGAGADPCHEEHPSDCTEETCVFAASQASSPLRPDWAQFRSLTVDAALLAAHSNVERSLCQALDDASSSRKSLRRHLALGVLRI
jgi:hypothetical protein